jgi:MerR family transcriptional regulator, light-induced transcriptional regulator
MPVLYLGPDLPVADWVAAVRDVDARAVVLGAVTAQDVQAAGAVRAALRHERPELVIAVGGPFAGDVGDGTVALPAHLLPAVDALRAALDGAT